MLTAWTICLLMLALLMRGAVMWRAWLALFCASVAGKMFPDPAAWVLIDLAAAIVVIIPPRAGFQKAIAGLFAAMLFFELGWLPSARMNPEVVESVGLICGWLQLAVLLTWGIDERYGLRHLRDWLVGPRMAHHAVDRR